jgi:hypothetical protein
MFASGVGVWQHVCSGDNLWRPPPQAYTLVCSKLMLWPPALLFPTLDALRLDSAGIGDRFESKADPCFVVRQRAGLSRLKRQCLIVTELL